MIYQIFIAVVVLFVIGNIIKVEKKASMKKDKQHQEILDAIRNAGKKEDWGN